MSVDVLHILHLEDEPLDSELAQEMLREGGMPAQLDRVETLEALEKALERGGYSLILSDYTIPGTDPLQALRAVRQTRPDIPFVFLSGTIGEERATQALKMGASDYVLKQRMHQLPQVVRRALGEAKEASRRRAAEDSLRRSEERLRLSQEVAELGSFEWDLKTGLNSWSPEMEALHGLQPGAFGGTLEAWLSLVHSDDREQVRQLIETALREGQFRGEWRIARPDGQVCWLSARGQVFHEDGRPARMLGAGIDITERKRREEDLRAAMASAERAKVAAEEATQAKDQFLAILSHELRTPLTAVMPALESMQPLVSGECREYLEMASRNIQLEARLIDDLLDITRITRGKIDLAHETVDLCTVVQWAAEVCQPDIKQRGQHFSIRLEDRPHMVSGDPSRLQQIIWNLLQNAVKFTPPGGCIGIRARRIDGSSVIEVHDSGVGIDSEALSRIFNAFEQEAKSTTRKFGGLGLGLAISKALTDMHSGKLRATSNGKDRGSTFRLEIPLMADGAVPSPKRPDRQPAAADPRNLRILLVEDHMDTARIIGLVLRKAGHRVTHAPDVATGVKLGTENEYDLLLSDLGLPDASGLDLMRKLREQGVTMPGIAFSGYAQEEDVRRSQNAGFSKHLAKPVSADRLLAMIAEVYSQATEPATGTADRN